MSRTVLLPLLLAAGLAAAQTSPPAPAAAASAAPAASAASAPRAAGTAPDLQQSKTLQEAMRLLRAHRPEQAILAADEVIEFYSKKQQNTPQKVYCARNGTEAKHYLERHARENPGKEALVVRNWCDAYYLKAFALVELGQLADARSAMTAAVALSPANAQYLTELGTIHSLQKNWNEALESYRAAEAAAEFSEGARTAHLARVHSGTGDVLMQLQRYDEAEQRYRRSLELQPNNDALKRQLEKAIRLRSKPGSGPS